MNTPIPNDVAAAEPDPDRSSRRSRPWRRPAVLALAITVVIGLVLATSGRTGSGSRPGDPFSGVRLFADPHSEAAQARDSMARTHPAAAAVLGRIASQPAGFWLGSWIPGTAVAAVVRTVLREAGASDSMPLLVLYAYPYRGCEQATAASTAAYEQWVGQVAAGIGTRRAAVVLEPDALAEYVRLGCLAAAAQADRVAIIHRAVGQLAKLPHVALYLDAGNSHWQPAPVMAALLLAAGVREARGFSLNVSNFYSTAAEESYGDRVGALLNGMHYVIDTSRNGLATATTWCNAPGQALGAVPTVDTGRKLADALLWIKPPGASDGMCNGGPQAGVFWPAYALGLAAKARWLPAGSGPLADGELVGDAVGPLPARVPVTEVAVQPAEHQQGQPLRERQALRAELAEEDLVPLETRGLGESRQFHRVGHHRMGQLS